VYNACSADQHGDDALNEEFNREMNTLTVSLTGVKS